MRQTLALALALACAALAATDARAAAAEMWDFSPPVDSFSPDAQFDLRALNEAEAGEKGFVKRTPDGNGFLTADGKPLRFWAMNVTVGPEKPEDLARFARFLAKRGVNMARVFLDLFPDMKKTPNASVGDTNMDQVDRCQRCVAAMKKEGIYSIISPFWPTPGVARSWNIPGQRNCWGAVYCDDTLQAGYRKWLKDLLTSPNPHGGVILAKEPAIAVIQCINEDGLLWWSTQGMFDMHGEPDRELCKAQGAWAAKKYGSIDAALAAWKGAKAKGDDPANGKLGFLGIWNTTRDAHQLNARTADQLEFLSTTMRDFYRGTAQYMRDQLGCGQLINASNWRPADPETQYDMERWSYCDTDVLAVNRYMSAIHHGPDAGWAIDNGDEYTNLSVTQHPDQLPCNVKMVVGHPFLITESCWVMPNLYLSEAPLLISSYMSLNGMNGYCWFMTDAPGWDPAVWPWNKMYLWYGATPMQVGQFPASALAYRLGYIAASKPVVHEERALSDMWAQVPPLLSEESGYDPGRDADMPTTSAVKSTVDPKAYEVGRVEVVYGGDPAKNQVADLSKYIDTGAKTITSATGEEKLRYGDGLFTLDAPKIAGAAGFLGQAGAIKLKAVTITCSNAYATIVAVSQDDKPLGESARILLQIGTTSRTAGWSDEPKRIVTDKAKGTTVDGFAITSFGRNAWQVEKASGTITIRNQVLATAVKLDPNGMPSGDLALSKDADGVTVALPADALYVELKAK